VDTSGHNALCLPSCELITPILHSRSTNLIPPGLFFQVPLHDRGHTTGLCSECVVCLMCVREKNTILRVFNLGSIGLNTGYPQGPNGQTEALQ